MGRSHAWRLAAVLVVAQGLGLAGPVHAWPDAAEPARAGARERGYAAAFEALGLGEPGEPEAARWRTGRGLRVRLAGLTVERLRFDSEYSANRWAEEEPLEPELRVLERRGPQVVLLTGERLADADLRERARAQAWAELPVPEGELATRLSPALLPPAESSLDDGLPVPPLTIAGEAATVSSGALATADAPAGEAPPPPADATAAEPETSAAPASEATGHGARALLVHYLLGGDLHPIARAGADRLIERTTAHREAIAWSGVGLYFGDHSSYKHMDEAERAEWLSARAFPGATIPEPRESSCIGWVLENVGAAYAAAGRAEVWREIKRRVVERGSKGTELAKELVQDGWSAIYFNPDTLDPEDADAEHTYTARMARRGKPYYKIPVSDLITDYRPSSGSETPKDTTGLERLAQVPFWFGLARGGRHTFLGHGAVVNEFHWTAMPDDPDAIEETPLAEFDWLSGVIVVPPGTWPE